MHLSKLMLLLQGMKKICCKSLKSLNAIFLNLTCVTHSSEFRVKRQLCKKGRLRCDREFSATTDAETLITLVARVHIVRHVLNDPDDGEIVRRSLAHQMYP